MESGFDFSSLFQKMPIPRLIIGVENNRAVSVIEVNEMALRYFDLSLAAIKGREIRQFMDDDNARHFEQSFQVAISRKRTVTIQALPTIPGGLRVYGFWVSPVVGADGKVHYLDILGQLDARDQSILQRERDDAISLLASIFEVSEVGIIVTDEKSNVIRVNDSFLRSYGWSRDEIVGKNYTNLIAEDDREVARINHKKFLSAGVQSSGEVQILKKSGSIANALFTSATLKLSQNRKFLVTTVMDITLRKQMEKNLRHAKEMADSANNAKSTFLANMSHELRTPLNAIIGFSELMIKQTFGPVGCDKYEEYLEDIHMSAEHLLSIINEVLDMSKIEAGRLDLSEEKFSIADVIDSVSRMLSSRVFASNIEIRHELADNLGYVLADYRLIRQVLINLLTNAIKFSNAGSEISIVAKKQDDGDLLVSVIDQGLGMQKDKIPQALEPFGQVTSNPNRREIHNQGTGLGLPLAKAMVEMHGGDFTLESELDVGTTVSFTIPRQRVVE